MSDDKSASPRGSLSRTALRDAAAGGARWVIGAQVAAECVAFASSVALAQLVSPAEFGHATIALIIPLLAVVLSFEGFGVVLVQRANLGREESQTAEFLSLSFGILGALAIWLTAPLWAEPLFGERTTELIQLASPSFAIASVGVVPRARLQRELDFRRLSMIEVTSVITGYAVAVGTAIGGLGAVAIIAGAFTRNAAETALMCWAEHPPRPRLYRAHVREIVSFGTSASLASLTWVTRRSIANVVLAIRLPAAQVGFYWRAYVLGAEYQEKLSGVMLRLAFPLFSRAETLDDMRLLRSRIVRVNVSIAFVLLTTLIVVAPTLIPWLFGQRWEPAVVPTQILAVGGMALTIMSGTEQLILALGRPRVLLGLNLSFLLAIGVAVFATSSQGLPAVCIAVAAVHVLMVAIAQGLVLGRLIDLRVRQLLADLAPASTAGAATLAVGLLVAAQIGGVAPPLEIAALGVICLATYLLTYRLLFGSAWSEMSSTFRRVLRPSADAEGIGVDEPLAAPAAGK